MFTTWVILHLFCFSVLYKNIQWLEVVFIGISISFPLTFLWIPFLQDSYGQAGPWCWIKNWSDDCVANKPTIGIAEQFGIWFGPAITCSILDSIAILVMIYFLVCFKQTASQELSPILHGDQRKKALKELLPLLAYPIIFCILLLPPLANRIYGALANVTSSNLILVSAVFIPLQSFCAGSALLIHIGVIKYNSCMSLWNSGSDNVTTTKEDPYPTEAIIPAESEFDRTVLIQNELSKKTHRDN